MNASQPRYVRSMWWRHTSPLPSLFFIGRVSLKYTMHMHEGFQGLPGLGMRCRLEGLVSWVCLHWERGLLARSNWIEGPGRMASFYNVTNGLCILGLVW